VGIAARDLFDAADVQEVGSDLSTLAEASLDIALESLRPSLSFAVLALGRLGGGELSYASDVDVVFVFDGDPVRDVDEAEHLGRELLRFVNGLTPADRIYALDTDLRPEGKQGALARSVDGYLTYFGRWAEVWERQAFARARCVAGDRSLGDRLLTQLDPLVWGPGLSAADEREIRRLKARIESERIPVGEDPEFHLKLGRGSLSDIEWTAQFLQLRHGVRATGTIDGLRALREAGAVDGDDADILVDAYEFLERTRNRLYLVQSAPGDSLPSQPEPLEWLARSLDTTPFELRDHYRRVTRRARKVFERLFYGQQ
jgi:glutamate-ammonia-ligase adenylyltransferase